MFFSVECRRLSASPFALSNELRVSRGRASRRRERPGVAMRRVAMRRVGRVRLAARDVDQFGSLVSLRGVI